MVDSNSLKNHPEIERTRRYLMITLVVCFIIDSIDVIFGHNLNLSGLNGTLNYILLICVGILYGFNLFIVYRYSALGIHIFAGIHIVLLVIEVILTAILLVTVVTALHVVSQSETQDIRTQKILTASSIFVYIYALFEVCEFIITIIIITLSFKLARLISANECATIERI